LDGPSKPGKRFLKILMTSIVLLTVLFLLALLIVPRMIPWDKVKQQAEEKISATVHHKVSIGGIGFNLLKGIEVKDLRIENGPGFSKDPFLFDEAVVVHYRLLPLLFGKIFIKAVVLHKPQLLIEKKKDGTYNFSDMLPAKTKVDQNESQEKKAASIPLDLWVSRFAVEDAVLIYRDLATRTDYRIDNFNLEIENLSLAGITPVSLKLAAKITAFETVYPVQLDASFRFDYFQESLVLDALLLEVPGVKITAAGSVEQIMRDPQLKLSGKADLDSQKMLSELPPPLLKKKIPEDLKIKGISGITFNLSGSAKHLDRFSLTADEHIAVELAVKGLTIPLSIQGKVGFSKGNAHVNQTLTFPGFKAELQAKLADVMDARFLTAAMNSTMKIGEMMPTMIPAQLTEKFNGLETGGTVMVSASVKGAVNQPKALSLAGKIEMKDGLVAYQEKSLVEGMSWLLTVVPDKVMLKRLDARLAGQPISGQFTADRFDLRNPETLKPSTLKTRLVWEVTSSLLDVDALLALMPQKEKKEKADDTPKGEAVSVPDKPEPDVRAWVPAGLEVSGKAGLGGLKFGKVKLGKIDFRFEQKKRLVTMSGRIRGYQGRIQNATQLDYSKKLLRYDIKTDVTKVDLEPLLNDVVDTFLAAKLKKPEIVDELKDKLTGQMDGTLTLAGRGVRSQTALPNLQGKGNFTIKAGRIRELGFQDELAKLFGSEKFRQDIPFDHTVIRFVIARQQVHVEKFIMESGLRGQSGDIRMTANGVIRFGAVFQNFKLRPRMNPRAANNLSDQFRQYSEILKDERGWITIPVILKGPMKKPSVKPDWDWIKKQVNVYAKRKVQGISKESGKKVNKFVEEQQGKSTKEIQENMSRELEKAKEKIKHLGLKNLFK